MEEVGFDFESNTRKDDLIFDHVYVGKYADFEKGKLAIYYEQVLRELFPGLNMILIHLLTHRKCKVSPSIIRILDRNGER